ncbi:hypothetical protein NHH03_11665 [Stieleria sp. TO1_6]|uniref:hypothetical protein n=1 Tax=Stieleria tagensis TaxID=2956795 RepID=UPI00209ABA13|nr:hypothetical protein [Stieleria tagensis]MCO8122395.1 hypothetical protein [Stieleria tagensis]
MPPIKSFVRPSLAMALLCIAGFNLTGCGGNQGGVIDMPPPSENPYQITPEQQQALDDSLSGQSAQ